MQAVTAATLSSSTSPASHDTLDKQFVDRNIFTTGLSTASSLGGPQSRYPWRKDRRTAVYYPSTLAAACAESAVIYVRDSRVMPGTQMCSLLGAAT